MAAFKCLTNGCCRPFGAGTAFPPLCGYKSAPKPGVRCTKHIIAHSQTIRSSLLLLFLSVHNKPYTNWEIYHERLA
ncbi:hypothetical protein DN592_29580, partial [Raoultella ornithinolytica]